jgi:hypothetical protein
MPIENQSVILTFNGQQIIPSPLITSIVKQRARTGSGEQIGCSYTISLSGIIIRPDPTAFPPLNVDEAAGISNIMLAKKDLLDIFQCDGPLVITCDNNEIFKACCRVLDISFGESADNLVFSLPYTIELETDAIYTPESTCCVDPSVLSFNEAWEISPDVEYNYFTIVGETSPKRMFNITHTLNAQAKNSFQEGDSGTCQSGEWGWQIAKRKIEASLGFDTGIWGNLNVDADCIGGYSLFNHVRTNTVNEANGEYGVTETWVLVQDTGDLFSVKEEYTVDVSSQNNTRYRNVSIQGTIYGFEEASYENTTGDCRIINKDKFDSAYEYWESISGVLHNRCQTLSGYDLGPVPTSISYAYMPKAGQINYNAQFESDNFCFTAPEGCSILSESIDMTDSLPADVYAEIQILGRPCPILQCLGIKTKGSKTINTTMVIDCGKICVNDSSFFTSPAKPTIDEFIDTVYDYLTGQYYSVFTDTDQESWDPKQGVYNRNITFSYADCCTGVG